jgi:DNA-directed RNA polymerase specialized sigma24 family protein
VSDGPSLIALIPRLRRYARALAGERAAADDLNKTLAKELGLSKR